MRKSAAFPLRTDQIGEATGFVSRCLTEYGIPPKEAIKATLVTEEAIGSLVSHGAENGKIRIGVSRQLGSIRIEMSAPGSAYSLAENMATAAIPMDDDIGQEAQEAIQNILLRSLTDDLKYRHKDGYNHIRVTLVKSKRAFLYETLLALLAAAVLGPVISALVPAGISRILDVYVLKPVNTVYMNTLRMVVAPLVFFSIVSCISGFTDLSSLGKIGGRTFALYMLTTVLAVSVGIGSFFLFRPGHAALASSAAAGSFSAAPADYSIKDVLVGMVPSNFVAPFLNDNMPQLIFLAVICGIATGMIGHYSAVLRSLFDAVNELFMKIASIIIRFMPVAVFCSVASLIIEMGVKTILSILGMFGTFLFGLLCMMLLYCLLMVAFARLDPRPFLRKYAPTMLQVFSMASSNAAIPVNMEFCRKKLGIGSRVYSLSIPLGSTLNMDGTCVQLAVFALALAKVYGIPVSGNGLITMAITIIILSMGAPGMPGAGVICLSVLLEQLSVPTEAVGLVMGIGPVLGMFLCMSNCVGDMVVTTVVAKKTGELDMEKYKSA